MSKNILEILINGTYFLHVVPDDYHKDSAMVFSQPIWQEAYGIMEASKDIHEVFYELEHLDWSKCQSNYFRSLNHQYEDGTFVCENIEVV